MALQQSFTKQGVTHDKGYWKLAESNIDHVNKTGRITFNAYHDKAARTADPIANVLDQKAYQLTPALYDEYITEEADIRLKCYELAKAVKEGPEPQVGEDDTRVSFFSKPKMSETTEPRDPVKLLGEFLEKEGINLQITSEVTRTEAGGAIVTPKLNVSFR